eukprot:TRINITY_DN247_c0_g1_i1.p1 TRINITY_DN247_c0_g1~~TRINITY_DN247_c0_g1_i1.p1  ORF type:complete len:274 (+),score=32.50 TRINITY_DN247_c0_g1_i1:76-897(+)
MRRLLLALLVATVGIVYILRPPVPFPDRLAAISEDLTDIDNDFYNLPEMVETWWNQKHFFDLSSLHLLNPTRIAYFDRYWLKAYPTRAGRFLEIGSGGGIGTEALAKLGYNMHGVDLSPNSVQEASRHAADSGLTNVRYEVGNAYSLPFADATFDGVVLMDVLEHLHDLQRCVAEVKRVLKPHGVFVFDTLNRTWFSHILNLVAKPLMGFHLHDWRLFMTPEELTRLLQEEGFAAHPDEYRGISVSIDRRPGWIYTYESSDLSGSFMGWAQKL